MKQIRKLLALLLSVIASALSVNGKRPGCPALIV